MIYNKNNRNKLSLFFREFLVIVSAAVHYFNYVNTIRLPGNLFAFTKT